MAQAIQATWSALGHMGYDAALSVQQGQRDDLLHLTSDVQTVYAVEHPPTITIGKNGTQDNILAAEGWLEAQGFTVRRVERGGDVTYHGPGQWVIYPVLHLSPWQNDVSLYVRMLEETVIEALKTVNLSGARSEGLPGVWLGNDKICAIGASVKRRPTGEFVTAHGLALNVTTDLSHFDAIVPCGIQDKGVTSVSKELSQTVNFADWESILKRSFQEVFQMDFS